MKKEIIVNPDDFLFTVKEVSILLKTDEPTVRRLIDKDFLKALKLGRYKVRREEIKRFLSWGEGKDFTDLDNVVPLKTQLNNNQGGNING